MVEQKDRRILEGDEAKNCRDINCRLLQTSPYPHCTATLIAEVGNDKWFKKSRLSDYASQIPENCTRDYFEKYIK